MKIFFIENSLKITAIVCVVLAALFQSPLAQQITHGPVCGAVSENSAGFVLRASSDANLSIQFSKSIEFRDAITSAEVKAAKENDYFALVYVNGLAPDTKYFYRAVINGKTFTDEQTRYFYTFPSHLERKNFTFLSGSCQKLDGAGSIFLQMAKEDARFFIQQGDWGYPDTTAGYFFAFDYSKILESYRSKYLPDYPMQQLLIKTPVDYVYDDHDMITNNSDSSGRFKEGIINSIKAYNQVFPHYALPSPEKGLWHKFTFANADIFMLDNRSQRDPNVNAFRTNGDSVYFEPGPGHSILGKEQLNWLLQELGKSNADWKFISSGTPFNPSLRAAIEFGIEMQKDPLFRNFPTPYGNFGINDVILELSDKWAGFPEDVYTLTKYVVEHGIKNIIFLTGDTHTSGIDDGNNSVFPELMAGPLDIKNNGFVSLLEIFGIPVFNKGGHTLANGLSQLGNAYGRISVFGADSVLLEAVTENGRIIGRHTVLNNYIPKRISATVAPNSLNFDSTLINTETSRKLIITNNSIDTLIISAVTLSDAHFTSKTQLPVLIPPKSKGVLQISFRPVGYGEVNSGKLVIYSNAQNKPTEINLRGIAAKYSGNKVPAKQPKQFELFQNYPNPFNPNTNITFYLPEASEVKLAVFDSFGREVKLLDKSFREPGIHQLLWDGLNNSGKAVSSGVYYLSLKAGSFTDTKKILLIR